MREGVDTPEEVTWRRREERSGEERRGGADKGRGMKKAGSGEEEYKTGTKQRVRSRLQGAQGRRIVER